MITITLPEWLAWWIAICLILGTVCNALGAYLEHLRLELERTNHD